MTVLIVVVAVLAVVMTFIAVLSMWWQLYAWRTPDILAGVGFDDEPLPPRHSFTLLAPARHEQAVLDDTLRRLLLMDHPNFEVIAIIGHDDDETRAVAERVAADHPDRCRVVIDHNWPKNKPKGMNTALPECRGEIVGVFDAEDEVDLRLLRRVDSAFQSSRADVVQGGVQLMNFRTSWFTLRNCLEYFIWFRSRLHLQALHNFIPLGGNTVFIKTQLLRDTGGWDGECLAEDCDLGVRLSSLGKKVIVCYDPTMATREETPDTIKSLIKQRTRWNQGFIQVLKKGNYKKLPRHQRILARYTLSTPFLQAFTGVVIPLSIIIAVLAPVPVGVAMLTFIPAIPTAMTAVFDAVALREFGRIYYLRVRFKDYWRLIIWSFPYNMILSAAAIRATKREVRGERGWEKTEHAGLHREPSLQPAMPQAVAR
ncbi:MAG: glycosyltransferase [Frankiaceae bacterium]|jgi:glycosyltransferase XagB